MRSAFALEEGEMTPLAVDSMLDALDVKLAETFGGRVVRKDLVKKTGAVTLLAGHGYNIYGNLQDLANRK